MGLDDIKLETLSEKKGSVARFFLGNEEPDYEYYKG